MDPQAESDEGFIVLSTSDYADSESTSKRPKNVEPFIKSFSFLPSLLRGSSRALGTGDGGAGKGPTVYFGQPRDRESSDFRTLRRGDLKLVREIRLSTESGVVGHQTRRVGVRRTVYHAEIRGEPGTVTVAMYQGDGAEEEWRKDIMKYESIWHANIMQLYGPVSTKGLCAMVFHDGRFQHLPILTAYIMAYCYTEFKKATNYISDVLQKPSMYGEIPVWIRPPTGELCLDLVQETLEPSVGRVWWGPSRILRLETISLDAPDSEDMLISSLSVAGFKFLLNTPLDRGFFSWILNMGPVELHWDQYGAPGKLMPNSWIRYNSHRISTLKLELWHQFPSYDIEMAWLAQANHIFAELQELEHAENYVCTYEVRFILRIAGKNHIPKGYLFVCPPQDFRTGTEHHGNLYQWPACPAYWSLDPSGADRLSTEDIKILGFPAIHIETIIFGKSWHRSAYEGLQRFHQGKGFDPNSWEVARQLGYPLYEVLGDLSSEVPFPVHRGELPLTALLVTGHSQSGVSRMILHFVDRWATTYL
ncbi:hypothetical protein MSAN_02282100 [Mycena sanguinolenta]|uniref:Uncharacterized protein n=1 Tax=Mycena sanguinolenta TaxID=230812 RepID=A0A8H6XB59_9AGAR|nr:hypothetical protein MSAN_02282100 [Mycena sanguinolenta]